jgi:threonine dehydratase
MPRLPENGMLAQKLDVRGQNVVLVVSGRNINSQQFLSIISEEDNSN